MTLLLLTAPGCQKCKMVQDALDGKVKFQAVSAPDNMPLCTALGVRSVPSLIVVKDSEWILSNLNKIIEECQTKE